MFKATATLRLLFFCTFLLPFVDNFGAYAQNVGDYRSNGDVNFSSATNWQRYDGTTWVNATTAPTSADGVITIRNHVATITTNVTLDQVIVDGTLQVNNGVTLTLANGTGDDLFVRNRLFFEATGVVAGAGQLVLGNQAVVQTANVGGLAASITSSSPTLTAGASYWFNGTTAQSMGFSGFANLGNPLHLHCKNIAGITIDRNLTITGTLTANKNVPIIIGAGVTAFTANAIYNGGSFNNCVGANITPAFSNSAWASPKGIYQSPDNSEPTTQSSNIWTNSHKTTVHIYWLKSGSGNNRIVVLKAGSPINPNAIIDNTTYTANPNFGLGSPIDGGFVVYNGAGSQIDVTGLTEGTTYHVAVFEYNQNCSGNANYKTGTPLIASFRAEERPFITEWITNDGSITIPVEPFLSNVINPYNYNISYRQLPSGTPTVITGVTSSYTIIGLTNGVTYEVSITGEYPSLSFLTLPANNRLKLRNIKQWGSIKWYSMAYAFEDCTNLTSNAVDVPNLSFSLFIPSGNPADMRAMFRRCSNFNGGNIQYWNMQNAVNIANMFEGATNFNQPLNNWNTQNVIDMSNMFNRAHFFNQPIGNWNTQNVTNMGGMFGWAASFNQAIGDWNTQNVTDMNSMFFPSNSFNQPIGNWNTQNVTNVRSMFTSARTFNQPIGNWNIQNVSSMARMFEGATVFNQPIGSWSTQNVIDMSRMFVGAISFNQPIGDWNTQNVTDMNNMFNSAIAFNQPIENWNTQNVANMSSMFVGATDFNQPIGDWNTQNVTDMSSMFSGAIAFNQPVGNWNIQNVTNMNSMFSLATTFNQPIENWNTQNVANMSGMFHMAIAFNQPIGNWNVKKVTKMGGMFSKANSFNQPLGNWDTQNVAEMYTMFTGASAFDQPLANWNIKNVSNMFGMLDSCGMNKANYDATLIGWAAQNVKTNVSLTAAKLVYCAGTAARNHLIMNKGWSITKDAMDCDFTVFGNVYADMNNNCTKETGEINLRSLVLKATPGDYYGMTDISGNYIIGFPSAGTYQVELLPQTPVGSNNTITAVCPPKTITLTNSTPIATGVDFGAKGKLCTQLSVNVIINRFRRCFEGNTYITYKNSGLIAANNVTLTVELPNDIEAVSSVPAWTSQTGNTLTYTINQIGVLGEGSIVLTHRVVCGNEAIRFQERCIKATISPVNYCLPTVLPTWDNADLVANSSCLDNQMGRFTIKNIGTGNMADSTHYRIFYGNVIVQTGKVKLLANQEVMIDINNTLEVVRIEVAQTPAHPTGLPAMAFFNRCGNVPTSATFSQQLPNFNNIATGSACTTIVDSYDPNDKRIMPAGVTAQKIIEKDQELEFQIRFQNEGNGEAYKVVVRDTLDLYLDIASIRTIATSHNSTVSMEGAGQGIVIWTFDNINLPAKSVDEAGSIGMITFRIRMKPNLPIGTEIKNRAGIYFDFNSPIITNEALVKIGTLPTNFGNPANDNTIFPCPASPSVAVAGNNQAIYTTSTTLAATPIVKGYGKWSVVQGTATFANQFSPTSTVSNLSLGLNILKWTSYLCNNTSSSEVRIFVCSTISLTPNTLVATTEGANYTQTFSQTGGIGAITYSISAGTLPTGLTLNPTTGVLSGMPTVANTYNFTVQAQDANNCVGTKNYQLIVNSVPPPPAPSLVQTITFDEITDKVYGDPDFLLTARATSGLPITFEVVSGNVSLVGNRVQIAGTGTVTIRAKQNGNNVYLPATAVRTFTIHKAAQTLNFAALSDRIWNSGNFRLDATSSLGLPITYEVSTGQNIVRLSGATVELLPAVGQVTITAKQAGNDNYMATSSSRTFNVLKVPTPQHLITVNNLPTQVVYGNKLSWIATANSNLPVKVEVIEGNAVVNNDQIEFTKAGIIKLRFSQAGNDLWEKAENVERTIVVNKAPQNITVSNAPTALSISTLGTVVAQSSSGLPVSMQVVQGSAEVNGLSIRPTAGAWVQIELNQAGNENYEAASPVRLLIQVKLTLQIKNLRSNTACVGEVVLFEYESKGEFMANNEFWCYLSDSKGDFSNPIQLQGLVATQGNTVTMRLPNNLRSSNQYQLKIVAASPSVESNTLPIAIYELPTQPTIRQEGEFLVVDTQNKVQWYHNGLPIQHIGTQYKPTAEQLQGGNDFYVVVQNDKGCLIASEKFVNYIKPAITATQDEVLNSKLLLFPNPTTNDINIALELPTLQDINIQLVDALGRTLIDTKIAVQNNKFSHQISLKEYASGVYLLFLKVKDKVVVHKVIKQ